MKHYSSFVSYMVKGYFEQKSPKTVAGAANNMAVREVVKEYTPEQMSIIKEYYFGHSYEVDNYGLIREFERRCAEARGLI